MNAFDPLDHTDMGNARRFVAEHGGGLRYVSAWRTWLSFDGKRWIRDESAAAQRAQETVRGMAARAVGVMGTEGGRAELAHAVRSAGEARVRAMLALASSAPELAVSPDQLDADPWLLNLPNGTLDLRTGTLRPHAPEDLLTRMAGTHFNPDAGAPRFDAFLRQITNSDTELVDFLQRWAGYCLTGVTSEHVMLVAQGTGANGKTTLVELLKELLGDYATAAPADLLLVRRDGSASNDVARLRGVRFLAASESDDGRRLSEPLVKSLTGGDTVSARFLYSEYFEFKPQCKIVLATNHRPIVTGTDDGIWRRLRLAPFTVTIPEDQRDQRLPERLRAELPGVLAWAVRGCEAWRTSGLGSAAAVDAATASYRSESDRLGEFFDELCVVSECVSTPAASLYRAYQAWCAERSESPLSVQMFGRRLAERGFQRRIAGARRVSWWAGVALRSGDEVRGREDMRGLSDNSNRSRLQTTRGEIDAVPLILSPSEVGEAR